MSWQPQNVVPGITWQLWPDGQTPPHCGAGLWEHGRTMSAHPQWVPVESVLQISLAGQ
jgi:hypothetical protein